MIDLTTERPLRFTVIAAMVGTGRGGQPINVATVWRWAIKGCLAPDGKRVRLETLKIGGHLISSASALQRFCEALTPRLDGDPTPTPRTATQRTRASERAAAQLSAVGI